MENLAEPVVAQLEKEGWGQRKWPAGPVSVGGKQGRKRVAETELDLPQALCPGDSPLHKDLPGELVVHELFSSVLQEICDEVSEGQVEQSSGQGGRR